MSRKADPLLKRAEDLVGMAGINATLLLDVFSKEFPFILKVNAKRWERVLTIAGAFVAVQFLRDLSLDNVREQMVLQKVYASLTGWDAQNGWAAFQDCKSFFEKTYEWRLKTDGDPHLAACDAIGAWVVWNILGRKYQSDEEIQLIRPVGGLIIQNCSDWFDENNRE